MTKLYYINAGLLGGKGGGGRTHAGCRGKGRRVSKGAKGQRNQNGDGSLGVGKPRPWVEGRTCQPYPAAIPRGQMELELEKI